MRSLEAGISWCLTVLDAAKERLEGSVQPGQYVLQHLGVEGAIFRPHLFDLRQLSALPGGSAAHATLLPGFFAFLERGSVEFTAAAHDNLHGRCLLNSRLEFERVGFAHR